jgi:hypothetical protein
MTVTTGLANWTADNTIIKADTTNFTGDGADLINGGGNAIAEAPPKKSFNALAYTVSAIVRF